MTISDESILDQLERLGDRLPDRSPEECVMAFCILEAIPDALVVVDRTGIVRYVNKQTETLTQYPRDKLIGQTLEILLPNRFRERHVQRRTNYVDAPVIRPMGNNIDTVILRADKLPIPVAIMLSPIIVSPGIGPMTIAVIRRKRDD